MAIDFTIEKLWKNEKSSCIAVINHATGTRCGYCSVSPGHPFYSKNYTSDEIPQLKQKVDEVIDVHGGVTYSGNLDWAFLDEDISLPKNLWWFGFDCNHAQDAPDTQLILDPLIKNALEVFEKGYRDRQIQRTHKDLEYVIKNCNELSYQLSKYVLNSVDFITN